MRNTILLVAILLASAASWSGLSAQRVQAAQAGFHEALTLGPQLPPVASADSEEHPSWGGRIVSGLASAVLGAGIGYFASQIAQGDWDEQSGHQKVDRSTWAAVGGAGGFALGFSVPIWGRGPGTPGSMPFANDRSLITGEAIREASLANALEAVRHFHPEWLIQRGMDSFTDRTRDAIRFYLDNAQLGGVSDLAGINNIVISEIRFFNGTQATARWGTGHAHGVVQVITHD